MKYTRKLLLLFVVIVILTAIEFTFPGNPRTMSFYTRYIFRPYQSIRNLLLGFIPFSVGDILYTLALFLLVALVIRWLYLLYKIRTQKEQLILSFIHTLITAGVLYILFIIGWGANYYKPSLQTYWDMGKQTAPRDTMLVAFDKYLVDQLNTYAPHYHALTFKEINQRSQDYYCSYTDCKTKLSGLKTKPSVFGYWMQYLSIQGYYNPFTGESQVNGYQPAFMLPFVVCHEMAHQSGIANEGDANLLAYVIGTAVDDSSFRYSCYLNLWLYVQSSLRFRDSTKALQFRSQLNQLTISQIDTLRQIRMRYRSKLSEYSGRMYDGYLRLHDQKHGIRSYSDVIMTAWEWEQKRLYRKDSIISIP